MQKILKKPTYEEYLKFDGAHCKILWKQTSETWLCPGCLRTKFEIMKWTKRFPNKPHAFMGWMAGLNKHHDHSQGYFDFGKGRFPETVICLQCNAADHIVKRKLKLPKNFSFSPLEISQFILPAPHKKHNINYEKALQIYLSIK